MPFLSLSKDWACPSSRMVAWPLMTLDLAATDEHRALIHFVGQLYHQSVQFSESRKDTW